MKKKLLFVNPTLHFGGAEKSLQTLLCHLDPQRYDIDLFLFRPEGELLDLLPEYVHVLPLPWTTQTFYLPLPQSCAAFLRRGRVRLAVSRALFTRAVREWLPYRVVEQRGWRYQSRTFKRLPQEYDAAIAYLEGSPIWFCADKVRAKRKIAYIHNDYRKLLSDASFDEPYLAQFDNLVTVSDACADVLRETFPALSERVCVIENLISPDSLQKAAEVGEGFDDGYTGKRLLTLGRLDVQKGYDMAIDACAALAEQFDFRWYVLGEGPQRAELEEKIRDLRLQDRFILLGTRLNPYPFLASCDLYIQPSRFEGKSIAIEEAKALRRPIVTTAFSTVADQITDGVNGSVAQIDAQSIAEKIAELLCDAQKREAYSRALEQYTGNMQELAKFESMLTDG